jgi:type VI secretion system VasD/TssJ family lipoprotein
MQSFGAGNMKKSTLTLLLLSSLYLPGCGVMRAADDSISGVLETIPLLRMVGIESRKPPNITAASVPKNAGSPKTDDTRNNPNLATTGSTNLISPSSADPLGRIVNGQLELLLHAGSWLNPNEMARSSPVRVIVFELQDPRKFREATNSALLTDVAKALGPDVRRVREFILAPNETVSLSWPITQSGYLGVLADFRSPSDDPKKNRPVIALDGRGNSKWHVRLSGNTLFSMPDDATVFASNDRLDELTPVDEKDAEILPTADGLFISKQQCERPVGTPSTR